MIRDTRLPSVNRLRKAALVLGAGAIVALAVGCTPTTEVTVAGNAQTSQGIAVSGTGSVAVQPDIAIINMGIEVTAPTVAEAREQAADAMTALEEAVAGQGVEDADIQTRYFNIYPQYSYAEGAAPAITGFTVTNQVEVKVRNIDSASAVLDSAIIAGGNAVRVNGISFTVDDPEQFLADARRDAVENARANAEILASAAGVELGAPISINESTSYSEPYPPYYAERSAQDSGGATSVNPGEQELTLVVSVVFDIAGED